MIGQLPPDQAEAVMLRIVAGLDVGSVAKIMRRSPGSVRVLSHRGLRRLEVALNTPSIPDRDIAELTGASCGVGAASGISADIQGSRRHG